MSGSAPHEHKEPVVGYVHTTNFPELLRSLKGSLIVSTYQAQRILVFSARSEKLSMLMRLFDRPTGIAIRGSQMALCAKHQIFIFESVAEIFDEKGAKESFDICFTPRMSFITGDLAPHEVAFLGNDVIVVNTRFSCLSKLSPKYSFIPLWKPPFITDIVAEDRCHLNGIAIDQNQIQFVSALAKTNEKEGWRALKQSGGILMELRSGEVVTSEMCMPHSPRIYGGRLWILNSGVGELQVVDVKTGKRESVVRLPGFLRGLTFAGEYAFIGVCKIREKKEFGNLPVETMFSELECALYCVHLPSGQIAGFIKFTKGIEELFDIQFLPNALDPHVIGFEEETVQKLFILPPVK